MARHRRRPPFGIKQDDLDAKDAQRLGGGRALGARPERREDQRAEQERRRERTAICAPSAGPRRSRPTAGADTNRVSGHHRRYALLRHARVERLGERDVIPIRIGDHQRVHLVA